jgi:hypothetical protein
VENGEATTGRQGKSKSKITINITITVAIKVNQYQNLKKGKRWVKV